MDVPAVFFILLMLPAAVKTDAGVTFWRDTVTLTCPGTGTWYKKGVEILDSSADKNYVFRYEDKGIYHCEYDDPTKQKYYFYVEGKACENCFELDAIVFLGVIIVDLVATVFVMMMVYRCTKRKASPGSTKNSRAPVPPGSRAPQVPSSDYEKLSPQTRSQDTYSLVNRTG
ncbi:unnamed protein product [Ophioblennius macclurei]